mmetsp:Transcript_25627/g.60987  ORF Transcript_25627/g.60987 Transcript_25627/m.60987 type:complete len:216 (+) Transcript_25627:455-1102(+)
MQEQELEGPGGKLVPPLGQQPLGRGAEAAALGPRIAAPLPGILCRPGDHPGAEQLRVRRGQQHGGGPNGRHLLPQVYLTFDDGQPSGAVGGWQRLPPQAVKLRLEAGRRLLALPQRGQHNRGSRLRPVLRDARAEGRCGWALGHSGGDGREEVEPREVLSPPVGPSGSGHVELEGAPLQLVVGLVRALRARVPREQVREEDVVRRVLCLRRDDVE